MEALDKMKEIKIAVAGTGYVGLSMAVLLSQNHNVTAVDIIPEKVRMINEKKSPIQDEYIEKFLTEKNLNLTATTDMEKAYKLLAPYRDLNSAIAALNTGRTDEADGIMQELDIQSPVAEYVRSLISARNGQAEALFDHLARACADPELKARAEDEADFAPYREDMRFVEAIK